MIIDATLFLTFLLVTIAAGWLFAQRKGNYTRWFYLVHAFGFACFAIGTLPDMQGILTMLGAVINIVAVGVGIVCKVVVEIHEAHGMDIRTGKLITHAK